MPSMGRGKIEIRRIENSTNRQVTFSKRRNGLFKKAKELAVLTDAQVGVIVFSANGKLYQFCSLGSERMEEIIHQYYEKNGQPARFEDLNIHHLPSTSQQPYEDILRIRHENDKLQESIRQLTGEDLTGLTVNDLKQLEMRLDYSFKRVRDCKDRLLEQQIMNLSRNVHMNQEQRSYYCTAQEILVQQQAAEQEHKVREMGIFDPQLCQFDEETRNLLQLGPQMHQFQLQPTQPNLQEQGLLGSCLQL